MCKIIVLLALAAVGCAANEWLVGWASTDITPDRPVALEGGWNTNISKSVQDRVTATALAIEFRNGEKVLDQAILVSCDLVAIRPGVQERVRERLRGRLPGFEMRKLLLNATHTHVAPAVTPGLYEIPGGVMQPSEYLEFLFGRLAAAAEEAWRNRKPAGLSSGLGHAVVAQNRRAAYRSPVRDPMTGVGTAAMYGKTDIPEFSHIEGYEDHGVHALFFWDTASKLTGIAIDVACPAQAVGQSSISADYWHDVRTLLRKRHSEGLFVLPMIGAAGDQSPRPMFRVAAERKMWQRRGHSLREEIGRRIANAVDDVLEVARKEIRFDAPFAHKVEALRLPARRVTAEEAERARNENLQLQKEPPAKSANRMYRNRAVLERYEKGQSTYEMELHVIRLGDAAIATNPFELFTDYGIQIQARSLAEQTLVMQLAGDSAFYLPTARALAAGGYSTEVRVNLAGPEGAQVLVNRTVETINSLWQGR